MFESPEWIIVAVGSLIFAGSLLLFGMRLLKRLRQDTAIVNVYSRAALFFETFFATLSLCILMTLWIEHLRDSFLALLLMCVLISAQISIKYFHVDFNGRLAITGYFVFFLGVLLYVFLLWQNIAATNLDSLPSQYSKLAVCERVIEDIHVSDRVIPVNDETLVISYLSRDYLSQGCEKLASFTLNTSDFEVISPQQEIIVTSESSWQGGAWIIKSKKTGVSQISITDGYLVYTMGVSVIPSFFGFGLKYALLQTISTLLLLFGAIVVFLSVKQKDGKNHDISNQ